MTEQQFTYWLQGFAELNGDTPPTAEQWKSVREHLALVFKKVTPPVGNPLQNLPRPAQQGPDSPYKPFYVDQRITPGDIIC